MNLIVFIILGLIALFQIAGQSGPQTVEPGWSQYVSTMSMPQIAFRWKIDDRFSQGGKRFLILEFENISEELASFEYMIVSNGGDTLLGSIDLGGDLTRLSGWFIDGVSVEELDILDHRSFQDLTGIELDVDDTR